MVFRTNTTLSERCRISALVQWSAWAFVGSVAMWRLRSLLFRSSTRSGRMTSLFIFLLTLIFQWKRRKQQQHKEKSYRYSFGITILGAISVLLSQTLKGRKASSRIKQLQRVVLAVETPRLLLNSFKDKDSDTIGIVALLLGILLGEWNATTVTLCMLTGGEALERACYKNAEQSLEALLRKKIHIEKCEVLEDDDDDDDIDDDDIDDDLLNDVSLLRKKNLIETPVANIKVGSRYVLRAGSHVPVDSEILSGEIVLDDSALTGEHTHKIISTNKKTVILSGSKVLSAKSFDCSGLAYAKALRVASKSTFELMKSALLEAKHSTSSLEIRSNGIATRFTPFTFAFAALAMCCRVYFSSPSSLSHQEWHVALSILMSATPCPLIIGVPVSFLSGLSNAARYGITIRGGSALEKLSKVSLIAFDKTGTLTSGQLDVTRYESIGNNNNKQLELELVYALEIGSNHVLANAIRRYVEKSRCENKKLNLKVLSRQEKFGSGVCGVVEYVSRGVKTRQYRILVGAFSFLQQEGVKFNDTKNNEHKEEEGEELNSFVAVNGMFVGRFMFRETLRPECKDVIQRLRDRNIRVAVLTGDRRQSARIAFEAAMSASLDEWHICLPHEKAHHVRKWQNQGHVVAVVGDGVNDAAAMVCADLGISIGSDAFVTDCSDITIVGDKFNRNVLRGIDRSISIACRVCEVATRGATYGFGASLLTMLASGFAPYVGYGNITPFGASLIQEVLDITSLFYSASVLLH